MRTAIAIFCKTPGISPVKTRLEARIGKSKAEEFYKLSLSVVKETILDLQKQTQRVIVPYWAVAEKEALQNPIWSTFECIWTGNGGLGERIYHVFKELMNSYENVIIMGSDSPQITTDYIQKAMDDLVNDEKDGIIGPCTDGGFVLFGSKHLIEQSIWTGIEYSRDTTLKQLVLSLNKVNYQYSILPDLGDVDNYEDLTRLLDLVKNKKNFKLRPQQQKLLNWLKDIVKGYY